MQHIGIDVGATKIAGALIENKNPVPIFTVREKTDAASGDYEFILKKIAKTCRQIMEQTTHNFTVGVCLPGTLRENGVMNGCSIVCFQNHPVKADLEFLLKREVVFANDANCFALSEAYFGAGKDSNVVIGLTLGTGLGSGVVIRRQLVVGSRGHASEWGHVCAEIDGHPCWCGRSGCFEQYLSGTGINRMYRANGGNDLIGTEIYRRYQKGEPIAQKTVFSFMKMFDSLLMDITSVYDPDIIVIGGGLSCIDILYDPAQWQTSNLSDERRNPCKVVKAKLGPTAGVYGAALMPVAFKESA